MIKVSRKALVIGGIALVVLGRLRDCRMGPGQQTPKDWNYEIRDGKRVPKAQPGHQSRRQLARGSPAGQLRHGEGTVGGRASIRRPASATRG